MNKGFMEYQLYIFDMDGTLYFQRPLQLSMGMSMLLGVLKPGGIRELRLVLRFRKLREQWKETNLVDMDRAQYEQLAGETGMSAEEVEAIIRRWIYEKPLRKLKRFQDIELAEWMSHLLEAGKKVVIYSDYPAKEKSKALQLPEIPCFYGGQKEIAAMKPNPKGIQVIMETMGLQNPEQVLMVGDRMSRDGGAAKNAGVDFLLVEKHHFRRKKQLKNLFANQ